MRRRIAIMTDAQWRAAVSALGYCAEFSGMDGDHTAQYGESCNRARDAVRAAPFRNLDTDVRAIRSVLQMAIVSSCNCEPARPSGKHASDCPCTTHKAEIDRVAAFASTLQAFTIKEG